MQEEDGYLESEIRRIADKFKLLSKDKGVLVIGHFDTDGITSSASCSRL
jgi:single-stranded DNA-specific DHH superfamily exonuclease